ncbi:alpha/beta fold hydrolase [Microbacterium karelineae]|uniref:alpha/beta fold hydrolase n=1 Tax=Microbacterium karelineae TaxID=2654283 RepID=UPI001E3384B1|nr:alpha/beta hydrolase [Microbacterium karelineae]
MTISHADLDEFAFLADEARAQGVAAPPAHRERLPLPDGRTLSAVRYGDGAPRVVLLHGAGLNAHTWDRTAIALGVPALAIDLPGHGESSWREDAAYTPSVLAPDLARGIEEWTSGPVAVVGHSLGGFAGIEVSAQRPDLVSHLMLVDIVPGAGRGGIASLGPFYERLEFESVDAVLDHAVAFGLGGAREQARRGVLLNTRARADGVIEWKHHMARLLSPSAPEAHPAEIDHEAGWTALTSLEAPVTLVAGSRGFLSDDDVRAFQAARPADPVTILDAPHNVQETAHIDLARLVRAHIAQA